MYFYFLYSVYCANVLPQTLHLFTDWRLKEIPKLDFKDLWDPDSNLYSTLSKHLEIAFSVSLKPNEIYDAYCLVNDEPNEGVNFSEIESSAGIFLNTNKKYNNKIFLRYYFEEEGEIYDEKVCVRDKD